VVVVDGVVAGKITIKKKSLDTLFFVFFYNVNYY
jgi:hypothetical protein